DPLPPRQPADVVVPGVVAEDAAPVAAVGELEMGGEGLGEGEGAALQAEPAGRRGRLGHQASTTRPCSPRVRRKAWMSDFAAWSGTSKRFVISCAIAASSSSGRSDQMREATGFKPSVLAWARSMTTASPSMSCQARRGAWRYAMSARQRGIAAGIGGALLGAACHEAGPRLQDVLPGHRGLLVALAYGGRRGAVGFRALARVAIGRASR